jgi:hypothetical protein
MCRKKIVFLMSLVLLVFGFSFPALACDENHGSKIRVQAPIDAIDCDGTPATVTLLGLQIDISAIKFEKQWAQVQCEDPTCADFEVGQVVKVELASDIPQNGFFIATELEPRYWYGDDEVRIAAPLKDYSDTSVTVLGLTVDISTASLFDDEGRAITAAKLMVGQFARLVLDQTKLPSLVATKLMVHIDKVRIRAPIVDIDCAVSPPTVTLFGLQIDISAIEFERPWAQVQCEYPTCADLEKGQMIKVELVSDIPDATTNLFTATELRPGGCYEDNVQVIAPLQKIDLNAPSVTVLGLLVDIGEATIVDDNEQPITLEKLAVGQFVEMDLVSPISPLSATRVEAQSPISQVEVRLLDKKKRPVTNVRDIRADVTVKGVKKALSIQNAGDGTLLVAGLPQGKAKIAVTCTQDGQMSKGSASVTVKTRKLQQITVRLKPVKK